ncbi:nucleoside phosphorylase domain-containing protein [Panaeolus papilionaceus]|nr:nucleoside phosphorylase domain-containing protein [Panaeolus papilionaceus]
MKDLLTDANFPRTADLRVYHVGVRPGEVANRVITVGSPSRANRIAALLDERPKPFVLSSERGFLTITGCYRGIPVSIVSIGMGTPNMDFFVREIRESVSGDMAIIRLGSCGALVEVPVGSIVVPDKSVQITRNVDFDFAHPMQAHEPAYHISKPAGADKLLAEEVRKALEVAKPANSASVLLAGVANASADSFYSSQGRQTSFPDHNGNLIQRLEESIPDLATLEMETFHLFHLAACWTHRPVASVDSAEGMADTTTHVAGIGNTPLTTSPVNPTVERASERDPTHSNIQPKVHSNYTGNTTPLPSPKSVIRAAAAHMVFAGRKSQDFITPEQVDEAENWAAKGVLEALVHLEITQDRVHPEEGSVWELA